MVPGRRARPPVVAREMSSPGEDDVVVQVLPDGSHLGEARRTQSREVELQRRRRLRRAVGETSLTLGQQGPQFGVTGPPGPTTDPRWRRRP